MSSKTIGIMQYPSYAMLWDNYYAGISCLFCINTIDYWNFATRDAIFIPNYSAKEYLCYGVFNNGENVIGLSSVDSYIYLSDTNWRIATKLEMLCIWLEIILVLKY